MLENASFGIATLVALGICSGFLAAMLGISGGLMVVPALIFGLPLLGITGPEIPKIAIATSLALLVPTAIANSQAHASKGNIDWWLFGLVAPSVVAGAFVTSQFMVFFSARFLVLAFVLFALYTAARLYRGRSLRRQLRPQPGLITITLKGVLGGALSSGLGLGAGFFAVPLLARFVTLPKAIGTAAVLALPMAVVGTLSYLLAATPRGCDGRCAGYVFLPAVAAIGISTVLAAPVGAWAARVVPAPVVRRGFALLLICAATHLAYTTFTLKMVMDETGRIVATAQRLVRPAVIVVQPAEAPAWIGDPVPAPYFALARRYGPQRSFLLLLVDQGTAAPLAIRPVITDFSQPRQYGFATVTTPAAIERVSAKLATKPAHQFETTAFVAAEDKTAGIVKPPSVRLAHRPVAARSRAKRVNTAAGMP